MAVCGKVEISISREGSYVFTGIGKIGCVRRFDWKAIQTIRENTTNATYPGGHNAAIVLEGNNRLKFGSGLNEERRYFVLNALKYLKARNH